MRVLAALLSALILSILPLAALAVSIPMNAADLNAAYGVNGSLRGQALEDELNTKVFNPLGIEFEAGAATGGTVAVDDMAFEGPGLTVITGWGFILRFAQNVSAVALTFGNFKDDEDRHLYAFDPQIDYTRSETEFSQSSNGNPTGWTESLGSNIDFTEGTVPSSPAGATLLLTVTDGPGRISSIWADTDKFLTSLEGIEVIPEPTSAVLLATALAGLAVWRRRSSV